LSVAYFDPDRVSLLAFAGILWDIAGAIFLAKAYAVVDDAQLERQAATYFDMNPSVLRALCEQRLDARIGLCFLLVGFTFQALSAAGVSITIGLFILLIVCGCMVAFRHLYLFPVNSIASTLRAARGHTITETTWRHHFPDISPIQWRAAVKRAKIKNKMGAS